MKKRKISLLPMAFCFICFSFLIFVLYKTLKCNIDSDMSSELILGKILSEENGVLTNSWYYSTELRVLNTQLIYALVFKFASNWHLVRIISTLIFDIMLLTSYLFLCKAMDISKYKFIFAAFLFLPFSYEYFEFVLKGEYYIPHIIISFITISLVEMFSSTSKKGAGLLLFSALLAFIAGLGGPRQIFVLYLPLFASSVLYCLYKYFMMINCDFHQFFSKDNLKKFITSEDNDRRYLTISVVSFFSSAIGYLINSKVLHNYYTFATMDDFRIEFHMYRLFGAMKDFLYAFGYSSGSIFSKSLLINIAVCIVILFFAAAMLKGFLSKNDKLIRFNLFVLIALCMYVALYLFTNMECEPRYCLPIIIFFIPSIHLLFNSINLKGKDENSLLMILILMLICNSSFMYISEISDDDTYELRQIIKVLEDGNYNNGYATFWNANVLTELSNGNIEVWDWMDSVDGSDMPLYDIDETFEWLQKKSHVNSNPGGKVFLLFTVNEYDNLNWDLEQQYIIYQTDEYIAFGYNSYDEAKMDTKN